MFESHTQPIVPRAEFLKRLAASAGFGLAAIAGSLLVGMLGFREIEGMGWVDSFLNAAMLMGGEGPLDHPRNDAGKIFEGVYALYCGVAFISVAGIIFAPVVHRFLHKLHREGPPS